MLLAAVAARRCARNAAQNASLLPAALSAPI
jgi:hypothetical protein